MASIMSLEEMEEWRLNAISKLLEHAEDGNEEAIKILITDLDAMSRAIRRRKNID